MPVNFPKQLQLHPIAGIKIGYAQAGIKNADTEKKKKDLLILSLDEGCSVAGVFTTNEYCAAPVTLCRQNLKTVKENKQSIRALLINTGNANAGTGEQGLKNAQAMCKTVASSLNIQEHQVLPFSTGVILEPLPMDRIMLASALPKAIDNSQKGLHHWEDAAQAILTTDTVTKAVSQKVILNSGKTITITGISKGAGMIKPNMATMLGYIATDATISADVLQELMFDITDQSFNSITIDGDTSTNDSFVLIATNKVQIADKEVYPQDFYMIQSALLEVAKTLATMIVRDGEGATKFITINVNQAKSKTDAKKIGYAIAHSPLVKTAFFASDPNLGRILAAMGYAGVALNLSKIQMSLNDVLVVRDGARNPEYTEEQGQMVMKNSEITVSIDLGLGDENATVWTTDLSYEYVKINADYRS
jgi:glutamate N-acetyltransferase/amino-acid N-acetyltransferase